MTRTGEPRDYSLVGVEGKRAEERGLAAAQWYTSPVPRARLKELMRKRDGPAIRDTLIWLTALTASGWAGFHYWGTWWAVPAFFVYSVLYGGVTDSRWHECGHGTAFRTRWMNDVIYQLACFMVLREPTPWRWSHTRHHADTIIVGRDPEIAVPRPPDLVGLALNIFVIRSSLNEYGKIVRHVIGRLLPAEKTYIPESEWPKVFGTARIWALIYAAVIAAAIVNRSLLPLMYIGLPTFLGGWLVPFFGLTQHAGMAEDVLDHRLNTRTVYINPLFRFLYWNMNYHIEHHMFPMVPYHALPALHAEIKDDTPPAYHGMLAAYREIISTLLRQVKDPAYHVVRSLP